MPSTPQHIAQIATNAADIRHLQKGYDNLTDKIDHLEEKVDALDEKLDQVIRKIDASQNQIIGAGKLARLLWFSFPTACGAIGWALGRFH